MNDAVKRLLAYLDASGSGDSKLDRIRAIVSEREDIGCAELIEAMSTDGLPPGTVGKARAWMDDPSLVLPPRQRTSTMDKVCEGARERNQREAIHYVEPTQRRS